MKLLSCFSIVRAIGPLLVILVVASCKKDQESVQPVSTESTVKLGTATTNALQQSQTKTPSLFNNNLEGNLVHNYVLGSASVFSFDDNLYARTKTISAKLGYALLVVQGFGFTVPDNAIIDQISVKVRRFKTGRGSVKEYFSHLVQNRQSLPVWWESYGPRWADPNNFPAVEGEVNYSQAGAGTNGGGGDQVYKWTPAKINDPQFGVLFQILPPVGGSVVIYYDLVAITVYFTVR